MRTHSWPLLSIVVFAAGCTVSVSDQGGGASGGEGATTSGATTGQSVTGGGSPTCFGDAPDLDASGKFGCGPLTCNADQGCARRSILLGEIVGGTPGSCPEPTGCAQPPADACWVYQCWDLPADCTSCGCLTPHLAYDTLPAATCAEDADGHVWIDGAAPSGSPWKDPCFGNCTGNEQCWRCGPTGGCTPENMSEVCRDSNRCAVEDPSGYPHPTCTLDPPK